MKNPSVARILRSLIALLSPGLLLGEVGFTLLDPAATGIGFVNELDDRDGAKNRTLYNGSGVAAADVDGDGLIDLYFCGLGNGNVLYKNLGGFKFKDITSQARVECGFELSCAAAFADIDGDRDADLLVGTRGNGVKVFLNDGKGVFSDVSAKSGLTSLRASVALALADVDGDGDLDLYVGNNRFEDYRDSGQVTLMVNPDGSRFVPDSHKDRFLLDENGKVQEYGEPDFLYLNDGSGKFSPLSWTDGTFLDEEGEPLDGPPLDWTLTATFRDIDNDGDPDLYSCSDYWTPDRLWINRGDGKFQAAPALALRSTSSSSMGVDFGDVDRDGNPDFLVVDMLSRDHQRKKMQMGAMQPTPLALGEIANRPQIMRNTFFHNRGDGSFAEIANFAGLSASEWSWQPVFVDVDLDGYEDILVTAGHFRDVQDTDSSNKIKELQEKNELLPLEMRNDPGLSRQHRFTEELYQMSLLRPILNSPVVAFRNNGGDLTFTETTDDWGTDGEAVHHGIALADLDNDGDLDFVVNNLNSAAGVYRNNAVAPRLAVRLEGNAPNTQGIGALITVTAEKDGKLPVQSREMITGGRYLSSSDTLLVFAAASANTVRVRWPDGSVTEQKGVAPGSVVVSQKEVTASPAADPAKRETLFEEIKLGHVHHENGFDDFARQPLLPNRLSQLGPGLAFLDLDADGKDDLVIPSGAGGSGAIFSGGLKKHEELPATARDQLAVLIIAPASDPLITVSDFEDENAAGLIGHSLSAADVDGDGDLDLFVGKRSIPGRYPEPASSSLMIRQDDGTLAPGHLFEKIGLVTASAFADLDGDGDPDLIIAREWGSPMVFLNDQGRFKDASAKLGLEKFPGWWNSVTVGDFDGDGRPDLAMGNWGRNSKYEHHYDAKHPLSILYQDFDESGSLDIVESIYDHHMKEEVPVRGLSCSSAAMPFIRLKLPTYEAFGGAGIKDILGIETSKAANKVSAHHLDHTIFFNRGDHFEALVLPSETQFAPVFGVVATDFDNDGDIDLFLAQNFFSAQIETPRIDAGRGVLLVNGGGGGFTVLAADRSGIAVHGDARGAASGDFDGDGRPDLAVAQNGAATKVFHNREAKPGIHLTIEGTKDNPFAIGARFRVTDADGRKGPIREISAGGGYLSQNSPVAIIPAGAKSVTVTFPDGSETEIPVPAGARTVTAKRPSN